MTLPLRSGVIQIKLREMTESVTMVQQNLPGSADSFSGMGLVKDGIYKRMDDAIENVFDICAILNADLYLGIPGGDEEILENLVRHGIFSSEMQQKLNQMKGFRNIVVHRYGKIDDALAFSILQKNIMDFTEFQEEILLFLESREKE